MQEIDNRSRISEEVEMKRKFNRNQRCIILLDIELSSLTFLMAMKTAVSRPGQQEDSVAPV